jgi:hypothetical protein
VDRQTEVMIPYGTISLQNKDTEMELKLLIDKVSELAAFCIKVI